VSSWAKKRRRNKQTKRKKNSVHTSAKKNLFGPEVKFDRNNIAKNSHQK